MSGMRVVTEINMVSGVLESSDSRGRIRLKENVSAMRQLEKIFNCEKNLEWDESALQFISEKWDVQTRDWGVDVE